METSVSTKSKNSASTVEDMLGERITAETHPEGYPTFVRPRLAGGFPDAASFRHWLIEREQQLDELLSEVGAIVFRGFPIHGTTDFGALIDHYPSDAMGYSGGAATRSNIAGKVFEATRMPADMKLPLHQEMAYLPRWPAKLAFYCHVAAEEGGATIIADVRRFEKLVAEKLLTELRQRGIQYRRNFRAPGPFVRALTETHRTWQEVFYTEDRAKAEADCAAMGVEAIWEDDGSLTTIYTAPGFLDHPQTGERHWFNHLQSMTVTPYSIGKVWDIYRETYRGGIKPPYDIRFGDGSPIPLDDVLDLFPKLDSVTVAFPWQAGDMMLVDNIIMMHGRDPYKGQREIQVALLWGKAA